MATLRVLLFSCVVLVGGFSGIAHAFSLGELQLLSKPGQPFQATAPIKLGKDEEIVSLSIGSASDYALLNLPHTTAVETLTAQVKEQSGGPVVWLQSTVPIQKDDFFILLRVASNQHTFFPFFRLHSASVLPGQEQKTEEVKAAAATEVTDKTSPDPIVTDKTVPEKVVVEEDKAAAGNGPPADKENPVKVSAVSRAERAIGVLRASLAEQKKKESPIAEEKAISHDDVAMSLPAEEPPVPAEKQQKPKQPAPAKATSKPKPTPTIPVATTEEKNSATSRTYGPVREGEHLTEIVQQLHLVKERASFFQTVVALWKHNKNHFIRNNMNGLKVGVVLDIPGPDEIAQVDVREARRLRLSHAMDWKKSSGEAQKTPAPAGSATDKTAQPIPVAAAGGGLSAPDKGVTKSAAKGGNKGGTKSGAKGETAPSSAQPAAGTHPGSENEELKAILTQLQVITRVLESSQAQQDRLEQRISALEQARKEWDFLRERINELEHAKEAAGTHAATEQDAPFLAALAQSTLLRWGTVGVGVVVFLGVLLLWLGRRKNHTIPSSVAPRSNAPLLRDTLPQGNEPTFGRDSTQKPLPPK
ncbi:MAG: hypothetical protein HQL87_15930 [Magnetococcales bacterium]|nr:hypothetical protein [Magnetococcales bacterium]